MAGAPVTVLILIDALGWEVVERFGFCKALLPRRGALGTVLGYSSAAIPSLLSGEPPARHGAWAMYRYAPSESPFKLLRFLPPVPHAVEWRLRALTKRVLARKHAIRGYYELYEIPLRLLARLDVAQRGDPYEPGGMSCETLFDRLQAEGVSCSTWTYRSREYDNFEALRKRLAEGDRVLFLYTAELDALMHVSGIFHESVQRKLEEYEARVQVILDDAARLGRPIEMHLFSDHGMTDVVRVVDLMSEVRRWDCREGRDFHAFYDSTMARFWCRPDLRPVIADRLNATGWGRVIPDAELDTFGCRFEDRTYGDVVFLLSPGFLIVPSFMSGEPVRAMHGYHPGDRFSPGCFMTNAGDGDLPRSIMDLKRYFLGRILERSP